MFFVTSKFRVFVMKDWVARSLDIRQIHENLLSLINTRGQREVRSHRRHSSRV